MASRCHPSDTVHRIESVRRYGTSKFSFSSFSSFDDGDDVAKTERHVHEEGTDARGKGTKEKKKEKKNRSSLRPWRYISLSFSFSRCLGPCSKFSFRKMDRRGKKLEYWRKRILEREEKNCNTDRASSLAIICRSTDIFTVGKGGVLLSLGADGQRPACPGLVLVENCAFREEKRKTFSKIDLSLENLFEILP